MAADATRAHTAAGVALHLALGLAAIIALDGVADGSTYLGAKGRAGWPWGVPNRPHGPSTSGLRKPEVAAPSAASANQSRRPHPAPGKCTFAELEYAMSREALGPTLAKLFASPRALAAMAVSAGVHAHQSFFYGTAIRLLVGAAAARLAAAAGDAGAAAARLAAAAGDAGAAGCARAARIAAVAAPILGWTVNIFYALGHTIICALLMQGASAGGDAAPQAVAALLTISLICIGTGLLLAGGLAIAAARLRRRHAPSPSAVRVIKAPAQGEIV